MRRCDGSRAFSKFGLGLKQNFLFRFLIFLIPLFRVELLWNLVLFVPLFEISGYCFPFVLWRYFPLFSFLIGNVKHLFQIVLVFLL